MKDLIITWLIFQLIMLGSAAVGIHNKIVDKSFDCSTNTKVDPMLGVVFPLVAIWPDTHETIKYCEAKNE